MGKLELEFSCNHEAMQWVTVNGKIAKFKKTDGKYKCVVDCQEPTAEVVICKPNHYSTKGWFWWNLLFFIISIFGIFDMYRNKKFLTIDCSFTVSVAENTTVQIKPIKYVDGEKFCDVVSNTYVQEHSNTQFSDTLAKKRHKTMGKAKFAIIAVSIIVTVVLLWLL